MFCPDCGKEFHAEGSFCGVCGKNIVYLKERAQDESGKLASLPGKVFYCNSCGTEVYKQDKFCSQCGKPLQRSYYKKKIFKF